MCIFYGYYASKKINDSKFSNSNISISYNQSSNILKNIQNISQYFMYCKKEHPFFPKLENGLHIIHISHDFHVYCCSVAQSIELQISPNNIIEYEEIIQIREGNGNPIQYSCLENPRDRGTWWAAVCGVAQSQTRLKWLSSIQIRESKVNFSLFKKKFSLLQCLCSISSI